MYGSRDGIMLSDVDGFMTNGNPIVGLMLDNNQDTNKKQNA